jgi:hypothetical protein
MKTDNRFANWLRIKWQRKTAEPLAALKNTIRQVWRLIDRCEHLRRELH